jgi:hypothetical protein
VHVGAQRNTGGTQKTARTKRVSVGRGAETAQGSRVTITSDDTLGDYTAYRAGDRFYIVLPNASAGYVARGAGKGYSDVQVQQRGNDVVVSYRVAPGAKPRVQQKFNRIDIVFDVPAGAQSGGQQNANTTQQTTDTASQNGSLNASTPTANQNTTRTANANEIAANEHSLANANGQQNTGAQTPAQATPDGTAQSTVEQSPSSNAAPAETQIAQTQPPLSITPIGDSNAAGQSPASALGAALARNWAAALLAVLLIVSLGLFLVMRRRAGNAPAEAERPSPPEVEKPSLASSKDTGPQTLANGTVLQNRYRIVRHLGRGGMGSVYEALDERLGRSVALKMTFARAEHMRRAFEREARILAHLSHPALPRVIDHFGEGNEQFLVMDYIPGLDLKALLEQQERPFDEAEVLRWGDELLDALEYLHSHEPAVVHRDIKPSNLKLTAKRGIVLLDFGLAKGAVGQSASATLSRSIMGYSPHFAPPEQMQGERTEPRSDLYSLAATLYNLLTGQMPPDAFHRVTAQLNDEPDPLRPLEEINPAVSPYTSAVIMRALAPKPSHRWPSASAMRAALRGSGAATTELRTSTDEASPLRSS